MSEKNIKITGTADFSAVAKEAKRLTGTIQQTMGKSGVQIFDDKSIKFLRTEAVAAIAKMQAQMKRLTEEAKNLDAELKSSLGNEQKHNELLNKRYDNLRKIADLQRSAKALKESERRMAVGGANLNQVGSAVGGTLSRVGHAIPRVGSVVGGAIDTARAGGAIYKGAGAMGAGATAGLVGLGIAATGLILAFQRASESFELFSQQVPAMISKVGMGLAEGISAREMAAAQSMGFDPGQTIDTQIGMARAFGTMRSRESQENLTINTMAASRSLGLDPSEISGTANQLRSSLGTRQSENAVAQILSRAMTQGMDRSQATHLLSSTAGLLSDINKSGLMSNDAVVAAMASLTRNNVMSPEQAAKTFSGMQSAITGSSGETNAFFQRAFGRAGVGGGSIFGAQYGVKQGLMGVDPSEFLTQTGNRQGLSDLRSLGLVQDPNFMAKRAQGILQEVNAVGFDQSSVEGRTQRTAFLGQQLGAQTLPEAFKIEAILNKLATSQALTAEEAKTVKSLGQDPESRWRDESLKALNSIAGAVAISKSGDAFAKFELGRDSSEAMNKLTDVNTELTKAVNGLTNTLTGKGAGESSFTSSGSGGGFLERLDKGHSVAQILTENALNYFGIGVGAAKDSLTSGMGSGTTGGSVSPESNPLVQKMDQMTEAIKEGNADRRQLNKRSPVPVPAPKVNKSKIGGQ